MWLSRDLEGNFDRLSLFSSVKKEGGGEAEAEAGAEEAEEEEEVKEEYGLTVRCLTVTGWGIE